MQERYLHMLWERGLFNAREMRTTRGQSVEIVNRGKLNQDSGPDFSDALIRIDGQLWAGSVEIHIRASDWNRHGHQFDHAYNTSVLHVVFESDAEVFMENGEILPCIELKNRIQSGMSDAYQAVFSDMGFIPCAAHRPASYESELDEMKKMAFCERLKSKAEEIASLHRTLGGDWQQVFFVYLCRFMGFRINAHPMEQMAMQTPYKLVMKNAGNERTVSALLFGQSGFLNPGLRDAYAISLFQEYKYLAHKYDLKCIPPVQWKLLRMRPVNFPTLRLAQLAAMLSRSPDLFSKCMGAADFRAIADCFTASPDPYWQTHYRFDTEVRPFSACFGRSAASVLACNVVVPLRFARAGFSSPKAAIAEAENLMKQAPPEQNKRTRRWEQAGAVNHTGFDSHALMALEKMYCNPRRCLECSIAMRIIST